MSKRSADEELTKDSSQLSDGDNDGDGSSTADSTWKPADASVLRTREIIKIARTPGLEAAKSKMPTFSFGFPSIISAAPTAAPSIIGISAPETSVGSTSSTSASTDSFAQANATPPEVDLNSSSMAATGASSTESTTAGATGTSSTTAMPAHATSSSSIDACSAAVAASPAATGSVTATSGIWKCDGCLTSNNASALSCEKCPMPRSGAKTASETVSQNSSSSLSAESTSVTAKPFAFSGGLFGSSSSGFSATTFNPFASAATVSSAPFGTASTTASQFSGFGSFTSASDAFKCVPINSFATKATSDGNEDGIPDDGGDRFEEAPPLDASTNGAETAILAEAVKDSKPEGSGEENDVVEAKCRCKLYTIGKNGEGKFESVDSGTGELHLNSFSADGQTKYRLLLRQEKTNKLILNSLLHNKVKITLDNNMIRFNTFSANFDVLSYILRVKEKSDALFLFRKIESAAGLPASVLSD